MCNTINTKQNVKMHSFDPALQRYSQEDSLQSITWLLHWQIILEKFHFS